ncbi:Ig-like domain-containing protein, partial [Paenibacillus sp. y28]|uniref:Ig-like domain-containing protein n=1 Tax=Paenibacillus sp. y28 TaxID=3129110 RepID=UPI003016BE67
MKKVKQDRRWMAIFLVLMLVVGLVPGNHATAADSAVLDQEQSSFYGNIWVSSDYPRYQTFTPAISGRLSRIENSFFDGFYTPGFIKVDLYKESDLSTLLASATATTFQGWVSFDFSGAALYLKRETMYRMVVSTQNGGSSGVGWYISSGDGYTRGYSSGNNRDFAFRTYMVPDYSVSPEESQILAAQSSLAANGTSQTTVTVQVKDAQGNDITTGGATVTMTSTLGTVGSVTDNNNGTYTATLTAPTTAGTATVSATLDGTALTSTAIVQFVPGAASAAASTVETANATLIANGTSQTTVTVKLKDAHGNALTTGGATVGIATTSGTVSGITDNNNGTYTATLTAPATAGAATVSATLGGTALASTAIVQFVPGAASAASSTVEVDAASLTADGTSQTTVTVKLKDAHGNALTTGGAT